MAKSLNRAQLIGNLTRDPELRYTPNGKAVCSFAIATNRSWTTETGEKRDEVDFHNIVAWGKLAEICSQYLVKGRKAYVEGRLTTRSWAGQDGQQKTRTEIVINDMLILDNKGGAVTGQGTESPPQRPRSEGQAGEARPASAKSIGDAKKKTVSKQKAESEEQGEEQAPAEKSEEEVSPEDIPF